MDIKRIIVREYLESLTESRELDYIFPILLESQGFIIQAKPADYVGTSQYGKDIVAVGIDFKDGIKKRFYFELKGGKDRHITTDTYTKKDGIRESLIEAKDVDFDFSNKEYEKLPLKIVLVHNGILQSSVERTFNGFIKKEFPSNRNIEFERWDIQELTDIFSEHLFGAYLLTDNETIKLFNKVLINLDSSDKVSQSFIELLDNMFSRVNRTQYKKNLPRKWTVLFESLNLISFIIQTEAKRYNNLEISKKYLTHLIVRFYYWILKNKLEKDIQIARHFAKTFGTFFSMLNDYFNRSIQIAKMKDGLFCERGGSYEEIGYTLRTFEYLQYLCYYFRLCQLIIPHKVNPETIKSELISVINNNSVSVRPILDIHSIPIMDVLNLFIDMDDKENARKYLRLVIDRIKINKETVGRIPDANNNVENVIKYYVTGEKPVNYIDSTSLLLAGLMEYIIILEMKEEYIYMRDFILDNKIDLGLFIPHHSKNSKSKHLIEDKENDLEEQLFCEIFFNDGYQATISLLKDLRDKLSFEEFKEKLILRKDEFIYDYRSDISGFPFIRDLAHIYFKTPYFPDKWRKYL